MVRYNTNGSLDTSFDGDGKLTTAIGSGEDFANIVAIQSDGKIVVAGTGNLDFAVVRYNTNGSLHTLFDSDGKERRLMLRRTTLRTAWPSKATVGLYWWELTTIRRSDQDATAIQSTALKIAMAKANVLVVRRMIIPALTFIDLIEMARPASRRGIIN